MITAPIAKVSVPGTCIKILGNLYLRTTALRCIAAIFKNFFFLQYKAAFFSSGIPVSKVDHLLDRKIPFLPGKVNIYLDFIAFWVRSLGFLLKNCGRKAFPPVRNFLETMGALYAYAAEVYSKNMSTTDRPFYIARPRFLLIHAVDPHLMCIPSLHVMVVIRTYSVFREMLKILGEEEKFASQAEELRLGALAITEAVLYVKQHSVNCISAAMYAMTSFDPRLFPQEEAERFTSEIFRNAKAPAGKDSDNIRDHILSLYNKFRAEGEAAVHGGRNWNEPLLEFLKNQEQVR